MVAGPVGRSVVTDEKKGGRLAWGEQQLVIVLRSMRASSERMVVWHERVERDGQRNSA